MKRYTVVHELDGELVMYHHVGPVSVRFLRWLGRLFGARVTVREELTK